MLTRSLDLLYRAAGALAGVFLVAIAVIVTAQIVARFFDMIIPSSDQFAGFCLAATSFLGLAYTFRAGGHIRVTLFVRPMRGWLGRGFLILALAIGAAISALFAWHTVRMVVQNIANDEVTLGLLPIPLWLPQLGMAVGVLLFAAAIFEDLVRACLGDVPVFARDEDKDPEGVSVEPGP
jgi:TRAP-type C4-dicarboxylate transport system permease small subunit